MPFLTLDGTTFPVRPGGFRRTLEARTVAIVQRVDGSLGSAINSSRGYVSVYSVDSPIMAVTAALALEALCTTGTAITASGDAFTAGTTVYAGPPTVAYTAGGTHASVSVTLNESL